MEAVPRVRSGLLGILLQVGSLSAMVSMVGIGTYRDSVFTSHQGITSELPEASSGTTVAWVFISSLPSPPPPPFFSLFPFLLFVYLYVYPF